MQKLAGEQYHKRKHHHFRALSIISLVSVVILAAMLFTALFEPGLPYSVSRPPYALDNQDLRETLAALTAASVRHATTMQVLTNGSSFYPVELDAIRKATRTINIEAYIIDTGDVSAQFIQALEERARAGVRVNILMDAVGSRIKDKELDPLRRAGARIVSYQPLRWYTLQRVNNRTHRELIIIDGKIAFVGGAGIADHWMHQVKKDARWRDTMVQVQGDAVTDLQATFAENWLEGAGEILLGNDYFPFPSENVQTNAIVVASTPTTGRSAPARILFQTVVASAKKSLHVTTPYFLPDHSLRDELTRAVQRGVDVRILVPGRKSDHLLTRRSSRRLYGDLLKAGAKIFEYEPSMIHAKILIADRLCSIVGSTNLDSRSFGLNDEVNLAAFDPQLAERLEADFEQDLRQSRSVSYQEWKDRPVFERAWEWAGALIQRQQ